MRHKKAVDLLNASDYAIEEVEIVPKSQELKNLLNKHKVTDPLETNLKLPISDVPSQYDMALLKLESYGYILSVLLTEKGNIEKINSDAELKAFTENKFIEYFQKYPPKNPSETYVFNASFEDYVLQLWAFSQYAQFFGLLRYEPFKILRANLGLRDLVLQLRDEDLLKEQGLAILLSEIHADKSNAELRAIFQRHKIEKHNIDKFFREHVTRKGKQGNPEEWWIYHDKDGFYYDIAKSNTPETIVERGIFDANEAYAKVETLNKSKGS